jgi:FlaA1/EpsC-like NDP-sugar epimerase
MSRISARRPSAAAGDRRRYGRIPLLLVGKGDSTELFLCALSRDPTALYRVVGIVEEMGAYLRGSIHEVEVLGRVDEIKQVVERLETEGNRPQRLVLTEDQLSPAAMRSLLDEAATPGILLGDLVADMGPALLQRRAFALARRMRVTQPQLGLFDALADVVELAHGPVRR